MYNMDRKLWYLSDCGYEKSTPDLLQKIFNSIEFAEEVIGKDISEFDMDEAIELLESFNSKSRARLKNTVWYLSHYYEWCYNKGIITNVNPFDNKIIIKVIETIVPIDIIKNEIISTNDLIENVDLEPDYINKFILICCYYGIKGDEFYEMCNLKIEDLDEENKVVKLITGRVASVDDYFIEHMKKANNAEKFITEKEAKYRNFKQTLYVQNDYIIRPTASLGDLYINEPVKPKFISQRMTWIRKTINNEHFTISNLHKYGLINYIKKNYSRQGVNLKTALMYNDGTYIYCCHPLSLTFA